MTQIDIIDKSAALEALANRRKRYTDMLAALARDALDDYQRKMQAKGRAPGTIRTKKGVIKRNVTAHAWDMMASKGQIQVPEWSAGDKLRTDWELSQVHPGSASSLDTLFNAPKTGPAFKKRQIPIDPKTGKPVKGQAFDDWMFQRKREEAQVWRPMAGQTRVTYKDLRPSVIDAGDRVNGVRKKVMKKYSRKHWEILEAVCIHGDSLTNLSNHRACGERVYGTSKTISKKLREAVDEAGLFYGLWNRSILKKK